MTDETNKILMFGLPESGKTSFLAALAHYVRSQVEGKELNEYKLSSNTAYLNAILEPWLLGKKQERTKIVAATESNTLAELYLEKIHSQEKLTLHIPDFFGEIFENQFIDRLVELTYLAQMKSADGLILFIHPDKIKYPVLIEDVVLANQIAGIIDIQTGDGKNSTIDPTNGNEKKGESGSGNEKEEPQPAEPFDFDGVPTQVILVDLLEAHLEYRKKSPLTIAVIVSAWDIVKKDMADLTPSEWMKNSMPLLWQYLVASEEKVRFKIFGISALGGDIENHEDLNRLTALGEPAYRVRVQEDQVENHNITLPIEWILNQWISYTK